MKIETQNSNRPQNQQLNILAVRRSYCSCGSKWSTDTNKRLPEDLSIICNKCDGYVTVDQIPSDMKFTERFGNSL
jgi:hypothetical protein